MRTNTTNVTSARWRAALGLICLISWTGCSKPKVEVPQQPRPVTSLVLQETQPNRLTKLTGSVGAWKTEEIGFQVPGRVAMILEPGTDIEGRTFDENQQQIHAGTVIAELEIDRFQLRLRSAEAGLKTAQARAAATKSELENIIPKQIAAANAELTFAQQEFERQSQLFQRNQLSQSEYDQAKANLDTAKANLEQTDARRFVQQAELLSMLAQVDEATEAVNQVKKDLDDTKLVSAFRGQIAEVHEIPGGYVQAGERVATVQMMDPIKVEVSVSAEMDERLNYNDIVTVWLPEANQQFDGLVYEKATLADAATRTYTVTLLVRNDKIKVGLPENADNDQLIRTSEMWRLFSQSLNRTPPYFVDVNSIHQDSEGYYVWRVEGVTQQTVKSSFDPKLTLRKMRVVPGERRIPFLNVAVLRELTDIGELNPLQDLVVGELLDAGGKPLADSSQPRSISDGGHIYYVRERWRLRPGDLVQVDLSGGQLLPGFYVPMNTIVRVSDKNYVFVIHDTADGTVVRRVEVTVSEQEGAEVLRRITAVESGALLPGTQIVAGGTHYLVDGQRVAVVRESENGR